MILAGWFTISDYNFISHSDTNQQDKTKEYSKTTQSQSQNDSAQQKIRENEAYKRGYNKGQSDGFAQGKKSVADKTSKDQAFARGYAEGIRVGRDQARTTVSNDSDVPMDRLQSLFNMTLSRGAAQGEVVAARKAAGKTLARWIKDKFGQDVKVDVT
jgi:flagellar biosynthesis/type III secretory pathway protein FliH